ncbi:sterol desaturase family protein [Flavobacteriales bacterium]|nr:sterol desaturase family protein [Flavobacteriales bacterium]
MEYINLFIQSLKDFGSYMLNEITFQVTPWYQNYFWWLIVLSLAVWGLEIAFPWRKNQKKIRKDFWLDSFYMFFNFYFFKLIIFAGITAISSKAFIDVIGGNTEVISLFNGQELPYWLQLIIFFLAMDFVQWLVHVTLHKFNFLWQFHKVHHSVEEMGFAAHLRFHWMENVFYTPAKYLMFLLIGGFEPSSVFVIYYINIAIGHLNHANLNLDYGPLKYILNNPKMHIWHHAKELPEDHKNGANFGISLSIWDYLFRTSYIPRSGRDIELGFDNMEKFPETFAGQMIYPIGKKD